jgi:predicted MFS family arabinose efflux permease
MACMGGLAWHRSVISWFDHWRGRAIALAVMGASLAGIMMPPLVTALVESVGWRGGFVTFALLTLLALYPLIYFLMKDRPEDIGEVRDGHAYQRTHAVEQVDIAEDSRIWTWREMVKEPALWAIALIFGSMGCVYSAVMLHLFGHLKDIGLEASDAALILSATALCSALGKPLVGWMSDQFGARVTIWLALLTQAVALLLFASALSYLPALLAAGLYGFGYSGMSPLRTFAVSTALGSASFAAAAGVLRIIELPLVIAASPLAGFIYDETGSYRIAFLILAGLMLIACAGPFFIRAGGARERARRRAAG